MRATVTIWMMLLVFFCHLCLIQPQFVQSWLQMGWQLKSKQWCCLCNTKREQQSVSRAHSIMSVCVLDGNLVNAGDHTLTVGAWHVAVHSTWLNLDEQWDEFRKPGKSDDRSTLRDGGIVEAHVKCWRRLCYAPTNRVPTKQTHPTSFYHPRTHTPPLLPSQHHTCPIQHSTSPTQYNTSHVQHPV